jgi:hypothetical protein
MRDNILKATYNMKITINIRNVDNTVYRRFRGRCVELNKTTGDAMTEAIEIWLNKYKM